MELLGHRARRRPGRARPAPRGASRPLVGDLAATELVGAEEAFLGPRVRALMVDLAEKDRSTEEHTRRVALLACAVGEELRLPPATLRHLAIGGLLHDMGKLRVAAAILRKPAALDRRRVRGDQAPPRGRRAPARRARRLRREVLELVLDHHERLDGGGYPRGLRGDQTRPRDARPHRLRRLRRARLPPRLPPGLEPERALGAAARGERHARSTPRCVAALERVLARNADDPGWVATLAHVEAPRRAGAYALSAIRTASPSTSALPASAV